MHNAHIYHRDLKPENILFDVNYNPKICDFSLSSVNANNLNDYVGSIGYVAPEILQSVPYDGFKADIFSLGQLLFKIVNKILGFNSSLMIEIIPSL